MSDFLEKLRDNGRTGRNSLVKLDFFEFLKQDFEKRGFGYGKLLCSWRELVGARSETCLPEKIERRGEKNILLISILKPFVTESHYYKPEFLPRINRHLGGQPKIDDIEFFVTDRKTFARKRMKQQPEQETPVDSTFLAKRKKEMLTLNFQNQALQKALEDLAVQVIHREYVKQYAAAKKAEPITSAKPDWRQAAKNFF